MPKRTTTKVSQNSNGQYQVTIPKAMGDALNLDGEKVAWDIVSSTKLALEKADD